MSDLEARNAELAGVGARMQGRAGAFGEADIGLCSHSLQAAISCGFNRSIHSESGDFSWPQYPTPSHPVSGEIPRHRGFHPGFSYACHTPEDSGGMA